MTVRELITKIGFRVDERALSAYDNAIGKIYKASDELYKNLSRSADMAIKLGKRMTKALSLPLGALATLSVIATSKVEQYQVSFEVMLKSSQRASKLMAELFQFEAVTPFNLETVMAVTQQLLIAKTSANDITKEMTMLGNIAAGDAERLRRIVIVLGQVRALGYLQGQDILQFTNTLVPIREAISKVTGQSGKALQKLIEQRKITAEITQKALELIAGQREGLMERQANTLGGLYSSLQSAVFRFRAGLGLVLVETLKLKPLVQKLIEYLNKLTKWLNDLSPQFKKLIVWVGMILFAIGPLLVIVGLLVKGFIALKIAMAAMGLAGFTLSLHTILPLLAMMAKTVAIIALKFTLLAAAIAAVVIVIEDIIGYFTGKESVIIPALIKFVNWAKVLIQEAFESIKEYATKAATEYLKVWTEAIVKIKELLSMDPVSLTKKVVKNIGSRMKEAIEKESKSGGTIVGNTFIPQYFHSSWMKSFMPSLQAAGGDTIVNIGDTVINVPPGTSEAQKSTLQEQLKQSRKEMIDDLKKALVKDIKSGTRQ